jgi:hypothetical protein
MSGALPSDRAGAPDGAEPAAQSQAEPLIPSAIVLDGIGVMMSEFVDNWPNPKRVETALALIAKTLRAALDENEAEALERAIDRMGWPEIHAFNERLSQDVYEDAGGFIIRKIKRLFGIRRDTVLSYQDAARAMVAAANATTNPTPIKDREDRSRDELTGDFR